MLCEKLHKLPREVGRMTIPEINRFIAYLNGDKTAKKPPRVPSAAELRGIAARFNQR